MRDVATHAGVSVSTVSHVINGTRRVEPETVERVREAIATLGYRPNLIARGLRRRETRTIGLIVPDNSNPFFADLARVIEDRGFERGYSVILCNSDLSEVKESTYVDVLLSKQVDGLVLISSSNRPRQLRRVLSARVPVVVVDREFDALPVDQVLVDNEEGGYLAGEYLVGLGHRRIGCIAGPRDATPSAKRVAGFRRALAEAGVDLPPEAVVRGDGRYEGGESAIRELLGRSPGLTAVFAYNDLMAIGALGALRRAGISVPGDVSVIGFDDIQQASAMVPSVTTIAQPAVEMAQAALDLLLGRIRRVEEGPMKVVLHTWLVERESCRRIAQAQTEEVVTSPRASNVPYP